VYKLHVRGGIGSTNRLSIYHPSFLSFFATTTLTYIDILVYSVTMMAPTTTTATSTGAGTNGNDVDIPIVHAYPAPSSPQHARDANNYAPPPAYNPNQQQQSYYGHNGSAPPVAQQMHSQQQQQSQQQQPYYNQQQDPNSQQQQFPYYSANSNAIPNMNMNNMNHPTSFLAGMLTSCMGCLCCCGCAVRS